MCSNQAGGCFLVYSATSAIRKHVCSNQVGGCCLVYSAAFVLQKRVVKLSGRRLFSLLIIIYYTPKLFFTKNFIKTSMKDTF